MLWLATGRTWPDALTAGALIGALGDRFLLIDGLDAAGSPATLDAVAALAPDLATGRLLGGSNAITPAVATAVQQDLSAAGSPPGGR